MVPTAAASTPQTKLVYRVKRGDTLASIARLYETTVASLKKWNGLRNNTVLVGQRLTILSTRSAAVATR